MRLALAILLAVLGVSAIAIAGSILILGAGATAASGEAVFAALTGYGGPPSPAWPPSMDSELRFYAALWGAYGIVLVMTARRLDLHLARVPWLAAVFFAGGVGRLVSQVEVGAPHPFFTLLMAIELATPPILILLWLGCRGRAASH